MLGIKVCLNWGNFISIWGIYVVIVILKYHIYWCIKMMYRCNDCGADIGIPEDAEEGEIIECGDCGLDFIVKKEHGSTVIQELAIEGEDWGE